MTLRDLGDTDLRPPELHNDGVGDVAMDTFAIARYKYMAITK